MTYFLFPGQGSQKPGMGQDFYEGSEAARKVFDEAVEIAGPDLLTLMFEGPAEKLIDTRTAQPALVIVGVAIARHLISIGVHPEGCAGHSVGEFAALVVAGSLHFKDALSITKERARLMTEQVPEGTMAAVLGLEPDAVGPALPQNVDVANYNGPTQTIISGSHEGIEEAKETLMAAGAKRVMPLRVSGPFHSSFMKDAAKSFAEFLAPFDFATPSVPFISSVSGKEERDGAAIKDLLSKQLVSPVQWTDTLLQIGPVEALECGPGNILRGISKRMEGAPKVETAGTLEKAEEAAGT